MPGEQIATIAQDAIDTAIANPDKTWAQYAAERPDAIVAANDLLAIGCIQALRRRRLSVPDDVAVTGMDDTEIAAVFSPSLTSVALGSRERGKAAAELLLRRMGGEQGPAQRVHVAPRLVVRESSGGPA